MANPCQLTYVTGVVQATSYVRVGHNSSAYNNDAVWKFNLTQSGAKTINSVTFVLKWQNSGSGWKGKYNYVFAVSTDKSLARNAYSGTHLGKSVVAVGDGSASSGTVTVTVSGLSLTPGTDYYLRANMNGNTYSTMKMFYQTNTGNTATIASYTQNSITVEYYGNGATSAVEGSTMNSSGLSSKTSTVTYGSHTAKDLYNVTSLFTKTGHHRVSAAQAWRVGSATSTTYMSETSADFSSYFNNGTTTLKLYANWTPNTLTVTYEGNGGTQSDSGASGYPMPYKQTWSYGDTYENGATNIGTFGLTKTGYHAKDGAEWNTATDGSGKSLDMNTEVVVATVAKNLGYDISSGNKSVTLYANWEPNILSITYNANGGIQSSEATTKLPWTRELPYSSTEYNHYNISTFKLTKTGYHAKDGAEWNTKADGTGISTNQDTEYTPDAFATALGAGDLKTGNRSINVYANWEPNTYKITFDAITNGGTCDTTEKSVTYDGAIGTLPIANLAGAIFLGWYTSPTGGTEVTSSTIYKTGSDVTYYARFETRVLEVTFKNINNTILCTNKYYLSDPCLDLVELPLGCKLLTYKDESGFVYEVGSSLENLLNLGVESLVLIVEYEQFPLITIKHASGKKYVPAAVYVVNDSGIPKNASVHYITRKFNDFDIIL